MFLFLWHFINTFLHGFLKNVKGYKLSKYVWTPVSKPANVYVKPANEYTVRFNEDRENIHNVMRTKLGSKKSVVSCTTPP